MISCKISVFLLEMTERGTNSTSSDNLKITEYEDKIIKALKLGNIRIEDEEKI